VVHSNNVSTLALGTKFDVKAFPKENNIVVSLIEGSIKVTANNAAEQKLNPNQQFNYNVKTGKHYVKTFDIMQVIGWRDNILIFDNTVLEDALILIERAYGVKIELTDESIKKLKIKANFENESIWTIVKVLRKGFGLDFMTVTDDDRTQKIIFFKKRL
jgi:ferric-dicitrate binding protein FerR (iron transport regulator)